MTREVRREADGPLFLDADDVDPEKGDVAVCRCGLSDDHPFCDGSHRATEDEGDGVYRYVDGERREVASVTFADGETVEYAAEAASGRGGPAAGDDADRDDADGEDSAFADSKAEVTADGDEEASER